jgi:hypothetical protein
MHIGYRQATGRLKVKDESLNLMVKKRNNSAGLSYMVWLHRIVNSIV